MKLFKRFGLQLFADGGEGGEGTGEAEGQVAGEEIPSSIPARARETYKKALAKNKPSVDQKVETTATEETTKEEPQHIAYADLIKSDEYKEEHKAYMDKTISERLKKYKGLEERQSKSDELLSLVAQKYNLDSSSESYLDDLKAKIEGDDSYYEQYAMDHDISTEEARRIVGLERKVAQAEESRKRAEEQARLEAQHQQNLERWNRLQSNAEATKRQFPEFNLEAEMQDEKFARLCAVNNDDTTAAYMACHWNDIMRNTAQQASTQAQIQTANAIASGKNRPIESGLSSNASAVVSQDFSKMNLQQIRAYAEEQRRKSR